MLFVFIIGIAGIELLPTGVAPACIDPRGDIAELSDNMAELLTADEFVGAEVVVGKTRVSLPSRISRTPRVFRISSSMSTSVSLPRVRSSSSDSSDNFSGGVGHMVLGDGVVVRRVSSELKSDRRRRDDFDWFSCEHDATLNKTSISLVNSSL